jgi:di/tricarboxylate transporter
MAAAIGIGAALQATGMLSQLAGLLQDISSATMALLLLFVMTALLTEIISNAAAAALMTPMALALATTMGGSPLPWALCVMMAASASFITPIGYQTNLMVYGPGHYRFKDFFIFGLPLTIIVGACTVFIAPMLGPLSQ